MSRDWVNLYKAIANRDRFFIEAAFALKIHVNLDSKYKFYSCCTTNGDQVLALLTTNKYKANSCEFDKSPSICYWYKLPQRLVINLPVINLLAI
ncbi:hypothetical protein [Chlorogloeopsis sp. ULAP02]|uniref:hypothetical protein n=1 Tax=Chlorogloeopsis sp. ULAP02 TaxID=3107926 RepID=UPI003136CFCD